MLRRPTRPEELAGEASGWHQVSSKHAAMSASSTGQKNMLALAEVSELGSDM